MAVVISQPADCGSVNVGASSVAGNNVTLVPRLFSIPADGLTDQWWWVYAQLDGVNGLTLSFTVSGGTKFQGLAENWVYSYDGVTWTKFDNVAAATFSNNAAFNQDRIYVACCRPRTEAYLQSWLTTLLLDSRVGPTRSGSASLVVGTTHAGDTTDDGRTTTARNIYGFKIHSATLPAGVTQKQAMVITVGTHPGEHAAMWTGTAFVDWLLAGSTEANEVLKYVDVFCYPNVTADGIYYGYTRTLPEAATINSNKVWMTFGTYTDSDAIKAAMKLDLAGYLVAVSNDFHAENTNAVGSYYNMAEPAFATLFAAWVSAMTARYASFTELVGAYTYASLGKWMGASVYGTAPPPGAALALCTETSNSMGVEADYRTYGNNVGLSIYDVITTIPRDRKRACALPNVGFERTPYSQYWTVDAAASANGAGLSGSAQAMRLENGSAGTELGPVSGLSGQSGDIEASVDFCIKDNGIATNGRLAGLQLRDSSGNQVINTAVRKNTTTGKIFLSTITGGSTVVEVVADTTCAFSTSLTAPEHTYRLVCVIHNNATAGITYDLAIYEGTTLLCSALGRTELVGAQNAVDQVTFYTTGAAANSQAVVDNIHFGRPRIYSVHNAAGAGGTLKWTASWTAPNAAGTSMDFVWRTDGSTPMPYDAWDVTAASTGLSAEGTVDAGAGHLWARQRRTADNQVSDWVDLGEITAAAAGTPSKRYLGLEQLMLLE
jgi:hypothetical protein